MKINVVKADFSNISMYVCSIRVNHNNRRGKRKKNLNKVSQSYIYPTPLTSERRRKKLDHMLNKKKKN